MSEKENKKIERKRTITIFIVSLVVFIVLVLYIVVMAFGQSMYNTRHRYHTAIKSYVAISSGADRNAEITQKKFVEIMKHINLSKEEIQKRVNRERDRVRNEKQEWKNECIKMNNCDIETKKWFEDYFKYFDRVEQQLNQIPN